MRLSKEELTEASSDVLQSQEAETRPPLYVVDIPPVEEDFPHLSGDKTNVYPLPISHENQCKIVGVASNWIFSQASLDSKQIKEEIFTT